MQGIVSFDEIGILYNVTLLGHLVTQSWSWNGSRRQPGLGTPARTRRAGRRRSETRSGRRRSRGGGGKKEKSGKGWRKRKGRESSRRRKSLRGKSRRKGSSLYTRLVLYYQSFRSTKINKDSSGAGLFGAETEPLTSTGRTGTGSRRGERRTVIGGRTLTIGRKVTIGSKMTIGRKMTI